MQLYLRNRPILHSLSSRPAPCAIQCNGRATVRQFVRGFRSLNNITNKLAQNTINKNNKFDEIQLH